MRTLIVGCDASGKSSMVDAIKTAYGDVAFESTSTEESQTFKRDSLAAPVNNELINRREALYMKLSRLALDHMSLLQAKNYVGTDSTLVTRLSHDVMRQCIGGRPVNYDRIVENWVADEANLGLAPPDILVMTHAPFDLILSRIQARIDAGNKDEILWGFNSPFFLNNYQDSWLKIQSHINPSITKCISFDTSTTSINESLRLYGLARDSIYPKL